MSKKIFWLLSVLLIIGCNSVEKKSPKLPPPQVKVMSPVKKQVDYYLYFTGKLKSFVSVEVKARVEAKVKKILFKPGEKVNKGDVLFLLEDDFYLAKVEEGRALVKVREAELNKAKATYERLSKVFKQGGISELDYIKAKSDYEQALANLNLARANLKQAEINYSYTKVRAPFTGKVGLNLVEEGDLVGIAGEKTPLVKIIQQNPLYVLFYASEKDWLKIKRLLQKNSSLPVEVATSEDNSYSYKGKIDFFDPEVDATSASIKLRAVIDNSALNLEPGLFVRLRLHLFNKERFVLPLKAVFTLQEASFVYVVDNNNQVQMVRVVPGPKLDDLVAIEEGLSGQEKVVVSGLAKIRPKMSVLPIEVK